MRLSKRFLPAALVISMLHAGYVLVTLAARRPEPPPVAAQGTGISFSGWDVIGEMIAARYFHFGHEPWHLQLVFLLDLPSRLIGELLFVWPVTEISGRYAGSYASAAVWLILGSGQWLVIALRRGGA